MNWILLFAFLFPILSLAQTDTLERKSIITGRIALEANYQSGNLEQRMVRITFAPVVETLKIKVTPFCQYSFGRIFNNVLQDDIFAYILADYPKKRTIFLNAAGMFESSKLRSIKRRLIAGPGIGIKVVNTEKARLTLINSIIYDQTQFEIDQSKNYDNILYGLAIRGIHGKEKTKVSVNYTFFYQSDFIKSNKLRGLVVLSLPVTKYLAVNATMDYIYEDIVDSTRERSNFASVAGVSINL
jgi:hypothetical protein